MPIQSPLSHITEVIHQVKASAQNYKTVLQNNEAATRATLIDPILRALGWDTSDARMVVFELTSGGFRVDYALRDVNAQVKAIVEAKAFGGNLDDTSIIGKLFNYAIHFGLREIWLTDGIIWHHHTNLNLNDLTPTKTLNLAKDDTASAAAYFVASLDAAKYWPKEITTDNVAQEVAKLKQQICEMENSYAALEQRLAKLEVAPSEPVPMQMTIVPQLVPPASTSAMPAPKPVTIQPSSSSTYVDLATFDYQRGLKPERLRLPDDKEIAVTNWGEMLRKCCEYVLSSYSSLSIPQPDVRGGRTNIFSYQRPHPSIKQYSKFQHNGQEVYVYLNYDGDYCVRNANYVLSLLPANTSSVKAGIIYRQSS